MVGTLATLLGIPPAVLLGITQTWMPVPGMSKSRRESRIKRMQDPAQMPISHQQPPHSIGNSARTPPPDADPFRDRLAEAECARDRGSGTGRIQPWRGIA